jgi:uncharacterized Zn finger protein (UPF0148 family)
LVKISLFFGTDDKNAIECPNCGYRIVQPYPKDKLCPKCRKNFIDIIVEPIINGKKKSKKKKKKKKKEKNTQELEQQQRPPPKEFETKTATLSSKLEGKVKVKKKIQDISLEGDRIELQKGEYIKLLGITSVERTPLFYNNQKLVYILELTNNLDFIATGILGGELDKMLLITENKEKEKCQWYVKNNIIYIVYGVFPDKKGKWILEQMSNHFSELIQNKDVDHLEKFEKYEIEKKFSSRINFILREYLKLLDVFSDQDIPYIEDKIRIDYLGLSFKSIGVISILLGDELNVEVPGEIENPEELLEMKESILTAKIEAIAANTMGNTEAMPKWIAVKLGFQNYRFLTFQQYQKDYFLYFLSEGNLDKVMNVEAQLQPFIEHGTDKPFSGNLRPFNRLKNTLKEYLGKTREF